MHGFAGKRHFTAPNKYTSKCRQYCSSLAVFSMARTNVLNDECMQLHRANGRRSIAILSISESACDPVANYLQMRRLYLCVLEHVLPRVSTYIFSDFCKSYSLQNCHCSYRIGYTGPIVIENLYHENHPRLCKES